MGEWGGEREREKETFNRSKNQIGFLISCRNLLRFAIKTYLLAEERWKKIAMLFL